MSRFDEISAELQDRPRRWLVTGAAGFIGSHIVELLLSLGQEVTGLDDFSTGHRQNLPQAGLDLIEGDIRDPGTCARAVAGSDHVLHQAALGSVPWSVEDPLSTHAVNVTGFLNIALACREEGARLVYAASSASYGDRTELPAQEDRIGVPLSPYAASKTINEIYAAALARTYGLEAVGLRYFNVFGPRQDPAGAYAAVIPRWVAALITGQPVEIYGDGETSRDFCYVGDVARANVLAALAPA
ncbi:MAG: NAD-dependent epimerase/dehydratase family protein, partial [Pseudomonadota bacterium]